MQLRETNIARLHGETFDVLIVGAGINGAVSAAALSAQGVRVALIDRGDFAGETSQESSNLVWGGIKYLESFEFGLVRELCVSRNHLIKHYPSTVKEIRFFGSLARGFRRSRFAIYLGTLLYWIMGNLFTRRPKLLSRHDIEREEPLVRTQELSGGVEYSDAYLHDNDARFVFQFVRGALDHGAAVANYVSARGAKREGEHWVTEAEDVLTGQRFAVRSRLLINACGPWADAFTGTLGVATAHRHVFSKGIHLIINRVTPSQRVLTFFADDGRLFFVIPMGAKSCIGTTDTRVDALPAVVTDADRDFVLHNINKRLQLAHPLTRDDVIAERCGVRPLVVEATKGAKAGADWMSLSRRHVIEVDASAGRITIFGGKLTDCLNVGAEIAEHVEALGVQRPFRDARWYGEPEAAVREEFFHQARLMRLDELTHPDSFESLSTRLWRRYNSMAFAMLEKIRRDPTQARILIEGTEYIRAEIEHAARSEMITKLSDFLRRRSKIALVVRREVIQRAPGLMEACRILFGDAAQQRFDEYFASHGTEGG